MSWAEWWCGLWTTSLQLLVRAAAAKTKAHYTTIYSLQWVVCVLFPVSIPEFLDQAASYHFVMGHSEKVGALDIVKIQ